MTTSKQATPSMLDELRRNLEDTGITLAAFIELTVQDRLASQKAWQDVFGSPAPGIMRPFKWEGAKLQRGDDLSKILKHEYTELFQQLKDNLVESVEEDEPCQMSKEQAFELMALR